LGPVGSGPRFEHSAAQRVLGPHKNAAVSPGTFAIYKWQRETRRRLKKTGSFSAIVGLCDMRMTSRWDLNNGALPVLGKGQGRAFVVLEIVCCQCCAPDLTAHGILCMYIRMGNGAGVVETDPPDARVRGATAHPGWWCSQLPPPPGQKRFRVFPRSSRVSPGDRWGLDC
jgi:hypothetical protein